MTRMRASATGKGALRSSAEVVRPKDAEQLPDVVGLGDRDEAVSYVAEAMDAWCESAGALAWLGKARWEV